MLRLARTGQRPVVVGDMAAALVGGGTRRRPAVLPTMALFGTGGGRRRVSTIVAARASAAVRGSALSVRWSGSQTNPRGAASAAAAAAATRPVLGGTDKAGAAKEAEEEETNKTSNKAAPPSKLALLMKLSKARLSALVVATTGAGYAMAPNFELTASHGLTMTAACVGTALCAASANTFNQWWERDLDRLMNRTRTRPLPTDMLAPNQALAFGIASGSAGVAMLLTAVNPVTAVLGLANIGLYAGVYTPMKQKTPWNTWVGALVGAIPPVMGYTAAMNSFDVNAALLGLVLFSWQMPHFMSLAHNLRKDYARAGHKMLTVVDKARAPGVSLRHALYLLPVPAAATYLGMTSPLFAIDGTLVNAAFAYAAWQFWKVPTDASARVVFRASLLHLPVFLGLMVAHSVGGMPVEAAAAVVDTAAAAASSV